MIQLQFEPTQEMIESKQNDIKVIVMVLVIILPIIAMMLMYILTLFCLNHCKIRAQNKAKSQEIKFAGLIADAIAYLNLDNEVLEELEDKKKKSNLEGILCKIVNNVRSYKPFLPKSMFVEEEEDNKSEVDSEDISQLSERESVYTQQTTNSSKLSSNNRINPYKNITPIHHKKRRITFGLKQKDIAMISLRVEGIHKSYPAELLHRFHTIYLEEMLAAVKEYGGNFHGCHSDALLFSWNAVSIRFEPEKQACAAALRCKENFLKLENKFCDVLPAIKLIIGVVSGPVQCGNVGCLTTQSFCFYGPLLGMCEKITSLNSYLQTSILVDVKTYESAEKAYIFKSADYVDPLNTGQPFLVRELKDTKKVKNNEWIYEIQEANNQDAYWKQYNEAWDLFLSGQFKEASNEIKSFPQRETKYLQSLIEEANIPYVHKGSLF